jgi:hypothetical protein
VGNEWNWNSSCCLVVFHCCCFFFFKYPFWITGFTLGNRVLLGYPVPVTETRDPGADSWLLPYN